MVCVERNQKSVGLKLLFDVVSDVGRQQGGCGRAHFGECEGRGGAGQPRTGPRAEYPKRYRRFAEKVRAFSGRIPA